ncbi:MAG: transcriptional repressor NrdR [Candidatus Aenigmarchaeota archaeon]|nr:transcriptional repressor NrdR [Candidatus Aenigmarchaeota archaeon]
MKCPYCSSTETRVLDKRETADQQITRRRRECLRCGKRFTTYERIEMPDIVVIKKDKRREPFNREKLKTGIVKACSKRPISMDTIENIVDDIERKLRQYKKNEIKSSLIGEMVIKKLRTLDKVAYIRFASVYRDFNDISSFEKELNNLKGGK